ncbi:S8 family peptidase [Thiobacillus sedimenti]|uniref:S8 family peptidase n=1 Tax=Thiobacillus sedimenti TaxID=3110231 RepID=A0ABZ1CM73_9PROT|nr:S8 family peptidase [Thiobacillus sp. SCUT-2]WRS40387.1 S8 family peptidase [Thiobacillus sp. SCUT-2]
MTTRYLIGRAELLTYPIEAPKKKVSDKVHPYTLGEAKRIIVPEIEAANSIFQALPPKACADDLAVARLVLHPAYLAKSFFPKLLLDQAGLASVGSRTRRIRPRRQTQKKAPTEMETTELFVAGTRAALGNLPTFARSLNEQMPVAEQFSRIETFVAMTPADRLHLEGAEIGHVFEVGLHLPPEGNASDVRAMFADYAKDCGFKVNGEFEFEAGRLLFIAVEGDAANLESLAQFTMTRVIRPMPHLRAARPVTRSMPLAVSFSLPSGEPLSREPKVAILDGGLPTEHVLDGYVRRYFLADDEASDVPDFTEHGLGVTSALLFGPIEPEGTAERPYAPVDHHRVLDARIEGEDPYELYRTLGHVETVLLSRQYQFINLSLGPDLPVEDQDVHAWTAVIDSILSDGETLMTVAVGNNGALDSALGLNRIQVPSDSVNALSVGAADGSGDDWKRANYSATGPGRSPGRRKPDVVAFGGAPKEYFHVAAPGKRPNLAANLGTSFAAPLALRSAVGIRAILGDPVHPLTIKTLLIHGCEMKEEHDVHHVGWGRVPANINRLITCGEGEARIIYQGELRPGKFLRAPIPLPAFQLEGKVRLRATFCYASPVDPQDAAAYTKAGLGITFRPNSSKLKGKAKNASSASFFPAADFRTEAELRADLGKWETVLHAEHNYYGSSLLEPVFDVHYNAREAGGLASSGTPSIRYALVVTVQAPKHAQLHQDILAAHAVLQALEPQVSLPLRT